MTPRPFLASLAQYEKQATELLEALASGDLDAVQCIRRYHPPLPGRANSTERDKLTDSEIRNAKVSLAEAQFVIARYYAFESWPRLAEFVEAVMVEGSSVARFE